MYNYSNANYIPQEFYSYDRNNYYDDATYSQQDDRSFVVPFVLGGITGGLLAPAFYNNRPYYYYRPPYYGPYYPVPYQYYW